MVTPNFGRETGVLQDSNKYLVFDRGVKTDTSFICRKRVLLDTFSRSGNDFDRFYFIYVHMQSPTSGRVPLSKMIGYH